jgi:hypothetical protein
MPLLLALLLLLLSTPAFADEQKPDDVIAFALTAEDWVTAATAKVEVNVNASIAGDKTGGARDSMLKAVQALAPKAEWRITSFNRGASASGLEQWNATFETRLPEAELGGINDRAKAASKPGMQLNINNIDFTPTLAENEAVRAKLRQAIAASATKELAAANAAFPDRHYRISEIRYGGASPFVGNRMMMKTMAASAPGADASSMNEQAAVETAQKMTLTAQVALAAVAPVTPPPAK